MEIKILLVDDEPANLALLEALLGPEGYTLIQKKNGEEALEYLLTGEPDLILLDVMMPGKNGFEVIEEIRKNEKTRTLPVILLSALKDREDRIKGINAGADEFISKPFDRAELVFRVKTQVRLSVLRRQISEKEELVSVMNLMLEGVIVTDGDYKIEKINDSAADVLGIKEKSGNLAQFFQEEHGRDLEKNAEKGQFVLIRPETKIYGPLFLSVEYKKVEKIKGEKYSYVFIFKDVTEEYTRNKMKNDFLSLISHKLRTPLTVISGYARMLASLAPDEKLKEVGEAIARNSVVMDNLIKRILYFVEIENAIRTNSANLLNLREIVERFDITYKKKSTLETAHIVEKVEYWQKIAAEELMENAIKFNDKENTMLKVVIGPDCMSVEDNGPGIPPEEREKVFEPFYQTYKNFTGNTLGAGLGLSIIKRLVESNDRIVKLEASSLGGLKVSICSKKPVSEREAV